MDMEYKFADKAVKRAAEMTRKHGLKTKEEKLKKQQERMIPKTVV